MFVLTLFVYIGQNNRGVTKAGGWWPRGGKSECGGRGEWCGGYEGTRESPKMSQPPVKIIT